MKGIKIEWTPEMIQKLQDEFSTRFSRDIGDEMGVSIRSVIRKARELGLEKESEFLDNNRDEISKRAIAAHPGNPNKGNRQFRIPNSERTQFRKGERRHIPDYEAIHAKRNATITREKRRIKYGLPQTTRLKLINIY